MSTGNLPELDLTIPADNGMRRGRTTGTCAAAAVKAALTYMQSGEICSVVCVTLPGGEYCLNVPVSGVSRLPDGRVRAAVVKDAGDDPDQTDGATIFATVGSNDCGLIRFFADSGVGTVTEPGISVPVGDPAINPAPREMIKVAIEEILGSLHSGLDVSVGCENGETIARKTFNPRLGIVGGISILGTTGVVEPMSLAAYQASIEVYIRVALGDAPDAVALRPGNVGISFARDRLSLPPKRIVHISNFVGFSLSATGKVLAQMNARLGCLWVLGHPGKLAKVLDGSWDTHSGKSGMAMQALSRVASAMNMPQPLAEEIGQCNTTEAAMSLLAGRAEERPFWIEVERQIAGRMILRTANVDCLAVRLFSMNGTPLGEAA